MLCLNSPEFAGGSSWKKDWCYMTVNRLQLPRLHPRLAVSLSHCAGGVVHACHLREVDNAYQYHLPESTTGKGRGRSPCRDHLVGFALGWMVESVQVINQKAAMALSKHHLYLGQAKGNS